MKQIARDQSDNQNARPARRAADLHSRPKLSPALSPPAPSSARPICFGLGPDRRPCIWSPLGRPRPSDGQLDGRARAAKTGPDREPKPTSSVLLSCTRGLPPLGLRCPAGRVSLRLLLLQSHPRPPSLDLVRSNGKPTSLTKLLLLKDSARQCTHSLISSGPHERMLLCPPFALA